MADAIQSSTSRVAAESDGSAEVEVFCDVLFGNSSGRLSASIGDPQPNPAVHEAQARRKRIEACEKRQRRWHKWICFSEIADWCARDEGSIKPNEEKQCRAYSELVGSLIAGEFDKNGKTQVRFESEITPLESMTPAGLRLVREIKGWPEGVFNERYLAHCWAPRALARKWFDRKRLPWPVEWDQSPHHKAVEVARYKPRGGRPRIVDRIAQVLKRIDKSLPERDRARRAQELLRLDTLPSRRTMERACAMKLD